MEYRALNAKQQGMSERNGRLTTYNIDDVGNGRLYPAHKGNGTPTKVI